jgi:hypothetical protein
VGALSPAGHLLGTCWAPADTPKSKSQQLPATMLHLLDVSCAPTLLDADASFSLSLSFCRCRSNRLESTLRCITAQRDSSCSASCTPKVRQHCTSNPTARHTYFEASADESVDAN